MRNQVMADYLREPRAKLFDKMIEEGTSGQPVQHWLQGLSNVSKAAAGAYMADKLRKEYEGKDAEASAERQNAMMLAMGRPQETQTYGDTTINWNEQKPNFAAASGALQSPYNADFQDTLLGAQLNQNQQERQFAQQMKLADMTAGRQAALQDAMLNRQIAFEKWKMENDPLAKIMQGGGSPTLGQVIPQQPIPQGQQIPQVTMEELMQGRQTQAQPVPPMQNPTMPQEMTPQAALFNSALAAKGMKAPQGYMYAPKEGGGIDLVAVPLPAKPLPASVAKIQTETMGDIQSAMGTQKDLGYYQDLLKQDQMNLGAVNNAVNTVRNFIGKSTPESRNYQSFKAALEKMRNDSLRLNKGVQTEGDAQRAWNELLTNINDDRLVMERLEEIKGINERAAQFKQDQLNQLRSEFNRQPLDIMSKVQQSPLAKQGQTGSFRLLGVE